MTEPFHSIGSQLAFLLINLHIATDRDLPDWLRTLAVLGITAGLLAIGSLLSFVP